MKRLDAADYASCAICPATTVVGCARSTASAVSAFARNPEPEMAM